MEHELYGLAPSMASAGAAENVVFFEVAVELVKRLGKAALWMFVTKLAVVFAVVRHGADGGWKRRA